jgi:hypothetical protein
MAAFKYQIKIDAEGFWVGFIDHKGDWKNADPLPRVEFDEAAALRAHFQEAYDKHEHPLVA